jgi:putative ABC transport system substrate-binding protein
MFRRAAIYVDKILKGAKPADLPARTADEIRARHQSENGQSPGSDDPPSLLARADEVIQ